MYFVIDKTFFFGDTRCRKIIVLWLCGYCGGAVDLIISIFTPSYRPGFNLEFETLFESF